MLNENIKAIRKAKGLSQQELAVKVNVVRQTVSKWEQGAVGPRRGHAAGPVGSPGDAGERGCWAKPLWSRRPTPCRPFPKSWR